jgi:hypothetical protein
MAPVLMANILTVTFVYCFAKISHKKREGAEEGKLTFIWLLLLILLFMMYGMYVWDVG